MTNRAPVAGQISMFAEEERKDRDRYMLEKALKYTIWQSAFRIRAFAALTYPQFQQYAHLYIRHELENSGWSLAGSYSGFADANAAGLSVWDYEAQPFSRRKYTWPACVKTIREMIDAGDWLLKDEEFEIGRIVEIYHCLPYPRSQRPYPKEAWEGLPSEKDVWDNRAAL